MPADRAPRQLTLSLPVPARLSAADFIVGASNKAALEHVRAPDRWPSGVLYLQGPPGSGKSHLVEVFRALTDAAVVAGRDLAGHTPTELLAGRDLAIDGADEADLTTLFHALNAAREAGRRVLLTGQEAPSEWAAPLPDLASRLRAATPAEIAPPDDELLQRVLSKLFADRQIAVMPDVVAYCLARMDRSFEAARALAAALDEVSLAHGRAITKALARPLLSLSDDEDEV